MPESIRILILEDNPTDAELIQFELEDAQLVFTSKVVMTEEDFVQELQEYCPDIILSDYDLPKYNGALALAEAKRRCPDTPFILVTGAVTEDRAIEILTKGAKDYVLKARLQQRLAPAVRRALAEAEEQRARKKADEDLREAHRNLESQVAEKTADLQKEIEQRYRVEQSLLRYNERIELLSYTASRLLASDKPLQVVEELCLKVMEFLDCDAFFNFLVDEAAGRLHLNACAGIPKETMREIEWLDYGVAVCGCAARDACRIVAENIPITPDVRTELVKSFGIKAYACHPLMEQNRVMGTLSFGTRSRATFSTDDLAMMKAVADQVAIAMSRVRVEESLRGALAKAEEGERILKALMDYVPEGITIADAPDVRIRMVSRYGQWILGGAHDRMTAREVVDQWNVYEKDGRTLMETANLPLSRTIRGETLINEELVQVNAKGQALSLLCNAAPIQDDSGKITGGIVTWRDITELKQAEDALRESEDRYRALFDKMTEGFAIHEIITDEQNTPVDYRFLDINPAFERLTGLKREDVVGKTHNEVLPGNDPKWLRMFGAVALTGEPAQFENYSPALNRHYEVLAYCPAPRQFAVIFMDITKRKLAEEALAGNQALLRAIIDGTSDPVYVKDCESRIIMANDALAKVVGKPLEEIIGRTDSEYYGDVDAGRMLRENDLKIMVSGRSETMEETVPTPNGSRVFLSNKAPYRNASGDIIGIIGISRNITARKQAEAKLHRYELLAARHRDIILFIELGTGRILEANDAATRAYGYTHDELLTLTIHDLRAADRPGLGAEQIAMAFDQGLLFEMIHRSQDGSTFPVEVSAQGAEIDGRRLLISVVHDITQRKRIETELREKTAALEERTRQMEAANQELESFSYSVSHDLRAPLRAIDGYSRMILKKHAGTFNDDAIDKFNVIRDSTRMMGQLIDDLLAFSRAGRDELFTVTLDIGGLIREVWEEIKATNPDRHLMLKLAEIPPCKGDRGLIKQVLVNILSNAVKFTRGRAEARIEVGGDNKEGKTVYYIRDNGVGFDMQYHDKLFGVFKRLHSNGEFEGTGVGLAIVQRIINRHGGRVWAEGEVDKGATFYFTLPTQHE